MGKGDLELSYLLVNQLFICQVSVGENKSGSPFFVLKSEILKFLMGVEMRVQTASMHFMAQHPSKPRMH
jgi:hypothetical protein